MMSIKSTPFCIFLLFALLFFSCNLQNKKDKQIISVTIMPQKYFAERIAGDLVEVNCVVPPGANPENYDATPAEIAIVSKSIAYFKVGTLGFELSTLPNIIENNPSIKIFDTSVGISPLPHSCQGEQHAAEEIHGDPHTWTSAKSAGIMAYNILLGLLEIDSINKEQYKKNYTLLRSEIDSIDLVVERRLQKHKGETFAIYHPSLSYFARDYGLSQLVLENDGKEQSAVSLKNSVDKARKERVKVVFIQKEFDPDYVETFAAEIGGDIKTINPLDYDWKSEMIKIADAFKR